MTVQPENLSEVLLVDRVFAGLEAAGRVLTMKDGSTLIWGFKHEEANLQSVVIADKTGRLELMAIVDDVLRLTDSGQDTLSSPARYREEVERSEPPPHIVVVARDQASLEGAYPLLKRWVQANLLGFNASCAKQPAACALVPDLELPTDVYLATPNGAVPTKAAIPDLPAAPIPLEAFTQ